MFRVSGNLKLKLHSSTCDATGKVKVIEPEVLGFIGQCDVIDPVSFVVEISVARSMFTIVKDSENKIIFVDDS